MIDHAASRQGKSKRSARPRTSLAPRLRRLLETSLYVSDLQASQTFYEQIVGLAAMFADDRMCALAVPGRGVLLLFRAGGSTTPTHAPDGGMIPAHDGHGALHLAFATSAAGIERWSAHLGRHGVAIESRIVWPSGAASLYFRDPDGHLLEIAGPGLWPNDKAA